MTWLLALVAAASPSGAAIFPGAEVVAEAISPDEERDPREVFLEQYTQAEIDFCEGPDNGQPYLFCLADRKFERGARELDALLPKARAGAMAKRRDIADFKRRVGGVTLLGDPVAAFETSQRLWEESYAADCVAIGLSQATGNAGTRGVAAELECRGDRIFERIEFLKRTFDVAD